jgi:branched-chain amino acid aminotransferase
LRYGQVGVDAASLLALGEILTESLRKAGELSGVFAIAGVLSAGFAGGVVLGKTPPNENRETDLQLYWLKLSPRIAALANVRDELNAVAVNSLAEIEAGSKKCPKATVFIIADRIALYPPECYTEGLEVNTVSTRRNSSQALNPNIKSLNYLNNILAKIEAGLSGAREAIMLSLEGYVAECTGDNIFFIKGNRLVTPPTVAGALEGITRAVVWGLASGAGLVPEEMLFTPFDLFTADEVFLTGTAAEVIPVVRIDARTIGAGRPGPKTQKLIQAFRELAGREGTPI